jgi:hypothetical protein
MDSRVRVQAKSDPVRFLALHKQYFLGWLVMSSGEEVVGLVD